ncbi:hypothetical protein SAMN05660236_2740 [Ohtaekwangia koreensis]|uniref:Uncharacterized protein n=1 Tax=Ohtaekwangia koreensis TaxID=688867 RepID=A0A1T5L9X9_9BACT|nr:hypothetical protein SAMN05660236_2740 [Ohtaekwangia koreensis]
MIEVIACAKVLGDYKFTDEELGKHLITIKSCAISLKNKYGVVVRFQN